MPQKEISVDSHTNIQICVCEYSICNDMYLIKMDFYPVLTNKIKKRILKFILQTKKLHSLRIIQAIFSLSLFYDNK